MRTTKTVDKLAYDMQFAIMDRNATIIAKSMAESLVDKCTENNRTNIQLLVLSAVKLAATVGATVIRDNHDQVDGLVDCFRAEVLLSLRRQDKKNG